jgi:hypothetical protein
MVPQRKRRLFLSLGLAVALALAVSPASASAVSTLTGENLSGSSSSGNTAGCPSGTSTFSVSGAATAPYPGSFAEAGTFTFNAFNSTFTISSGTTTVTGSKTSPGGGVLCAGAGDAFTTVSATYTATIHTPTGNFHDEGTSGAFVHITASGAATLTEDFTSSLAQPVPLAPTSKDQCKNNGWRNFPQFKSQGECVSFVATGGKNPPAGP